VAELIDPTARLRTSFLAAIAEFRADRDFPTPWFVTDVDPQALTDEAGFAAYVARVLSEREPSATRAAWFVPMTTLWWVHDDEMLGDSPSVTDSLRPWSQLAAILAMTCGPARDGKDTPRPCFMRRYRSLMGLASTRHC
jgi:hypothetical protein